MKISVKILFIIHYSLFIISCTSDGECRKDGTVKLNAELRKAVFDNDSLKYEEKLLSSPNDSITIFGVGSDSLIIDNKLISNIKLSLKNFSDSTEFVFQFKNQPADTVNFIYENENYFLSFECGALVFHSLKDVKFSRNNIDSVIIKNNYAAIGNNSANVKIYFKNR